MSDLLGWPVLLGLIATRTGAAFPFSWPVPGLPA